MLYDAERRYLKHAVCGEPKDHEIFFADVGAINRPPPAETQRLWDKAKAKCKTCPVLNQCRRDTMGEAYGVWGGLDPYERWRVRQALSAAVKRWPQERRLRWGQELARLREAEIVFREIQRMTGIPEAPAMYLIREWQRHLKELEDQEPAEVVELPAVTAKHRSDMPFPDVPGRRHLWARNNGVVQDCWYRGQTEDGVWINVFIDGRGRRYSSYKWIRAEHVKIYAPQSPVVMEYVNRPDRKAA